MNPAPQRIAKARLRLAATPPEELEGLLGEFVPLSGALDEPARRRLFFPLTPVLALPVPSALA